MVMPVSGHYMHAGIIKTQIDSTIPFRKNIWKQVIEAKLANQAKALELCGKDAAAPLLYKLSRMVKSGDSDNREAYGARMYWKALFGPEFVRDKDSGGINALLNYGYAVIRASVARAVCAAGLLPSFGIYHKNQLNPFCLADDLFEPFRPIVDVVVYQLYSQGITDISPDTKNTLTGALWVQMKTTEGYSPLFQGVHYMCVSYVKALKTRKAEIAIPLWEGQYETVSCAEQV
jgi:CRISPR-associated protein Cas1